MKLLLAFLHAVRILAILLVAVYFFLYFGETEFAEKYMTYSTDFFWRQTGCFGTIYICTDAIRELQEELNRERGS